MQNYHSSIGKNNGEPNFVRALPLSIGVNFLLWSALAIVARQHSRPASTTIEIQRVAIDGRGSTVVKTVTPGHSARRVAQLQTGSRGARTDNTRRVVTTARTETLPTGQSNGVSARKVSRSSEITPQ
ncbi:MAG TPA: hypothetical protein VF719_05325, partial [Abditibacteriaceae bacterium]